MTDEQRRQFLLLANRLANWHSRSRLDAAEFIYRNRADFDALAKPVAQPFSAKPPRRRKPHRWYHWHELNERQLLAIKKAIRKKKEFIYPASLKFKFRLISVQGANGKNELANLWQQSRLRLGTGRNYYKPRLADARKGWLRDVFNIQGTLSDRLKNRLEEGVRIQYRAISRWGTPRFMIATTLHPDDAWGVSSDDGITEFSIARDCCLNTQFPRPLLAKRIFLTDESGCCVYYIAVLEMAKRGKKKGIPEINRCYIGTVPFYQSNQDPLAHLRRRRPRQQVTGTYTRPENALAAAFKLYSEQVANVVQPKEEE